LARSKCLLERQPGAGSAHCAALGAERRFLRAGGVKSDRLLTVIFFVLSASPEELGLNYRATIRAWTC